MAKRRGNREGTIFRRKNGTWRAQVTLDGHRLNFSSQSRQECLEWIRKTQGQIDQGLTYAHTQITLEEFLQTWLASKKTSLRQSTWTHYQRQAHRYLIPRLGTIKLRSLRPDQIQRFYNHLVTQEVGIPTIRKTHTILHSALSYAVRTGLLNRNPASPTMPPKAPPKEMKIFDESQVSQMLVAAGDHRWEALFQLAVTTGMRQMELLGLRWTDLDWLSMTLRVERQLVRPNEPGPRFLPPKTRYGRRTVAIGQKTIEALRRHDGRQHDARLTAGDRWQEWGLIFPNKFGGPIHPRNLLRDFKILLREAGLPMIRFHDLRHTAASLMLNHGTPLIIASRRLGHARPSITLDVYGHLMPNRQAETAELLDALVVPIKLHQIAPNCTKLHQDDESVKECSIVAPTGGGEKAENPCI